MTYDLPAHGEPDWDTKLNPSLQYVKDTAEAAETPAGAQAKADAAQSAAISAAATDATNKANTAQANAISSAATDATTKANSVQSNLNTHTGNVANPHSVTKAQVGLGNVPNVDATARANHTGTQVASTISDLDSASAGFVNDTTPSSTRAALNGAYLGINEGPLDLVARYNLDNTGTNDVSADIKTGLLAAQSARGDARLGHGTFKIGATPIVTAQSFYQPRLIGAGLGLTKLLLTANNNGLTFIGGSGTPSGGCVSDLTIDGSGAGLTGTAIKIDGANNFDVERVRFSNLGLAILFTNETSGAFTEFCVARKCVFKETVTQHIKYVKGAAGNDSFHGSGFQDSLFAQATGATLPLIEIGSGARVYNAPFDGTMFASAATPLIKNNGLHDALTFGTLRMEASSATLGGVVVDAAGAKGVTHSGHVVQFSEGMQFENAVGSPSFRFTDQARYNSNGTISSQPRIRTKRTLAAGATNLVDVGTSGMFLAGVNIVGPNYEWSGLLLITVGTTIGSSLNTLQAVPLYDPGALGAPAFSITGTTRLTVTHASYTSSFKANVGIMTALSNPTDPLY